MEQASMKSPMLSLHMYTCLSSCAVRSPQCQRFLHQSDNRSVVGPDHLLVRVVPLHGRHAPIRQQPPRSNLNTSAYLFWVIFNMLCVKLGPGPGFEIQRWLWGSLRPSKSRAQVKMDPSWLWNLWAEWTEVWNKGYQWPHKMVTYNPKKNFKKLDMSSSKHPIQ